MNTDRLEKIDVVRTDIRYEIDCIRLSEVIKRFQEYYTTYPDYEDFKLDINCYDDSCEIILKGIRKENDNEYMQRQEKLRKSRESAKKAEKKLKEKEYQLYLELKKKFEEK